MNPIQIGRRNHPSPTTNTPSATNTPTTSTPNNNNNSAPATSAPQLQNTNRSMARLRAQNDYQPLPLITGAQNPPQQNAQGEHYSNLQPLQSQLAAPINNNNNNNNVAPNSSSVPEYWNLQNQTNNNNNNSASSTAALAPNSPNPPNPPMQRLRSGNANNPPRVAPQPKDPNFDYVGLQTLSLNKKDTQYVGLANLSVNNNNNSIDPNKKVEN